MKNWKQKCLAEQQYLHFRIKMVSDFSAISCIPTRDMWIAVFELGLWDFVRDFDDEQRGFMFSGILVFLELTVIHW